MVGKTGLNVRYCSLSAVGRISCLRSRLSQPNNVRRRPSSTRMMRSVIAAGLSVHGIKVDPVTGEYTVLVKPHPAKAGCEPDDSGNPWDEVLNAEDAGMLRTKSGLPKHCGWNADRIGTRRVRFRKAGFTTYLTGTPWSEDFMRQYADGA